MDGYITDKRTHVQKVVNLDDDKANDDTQLTTILTLTDNHGSINGGSVDIHVIEQHTVTTALELNQLVRLTGITVREGVLTLNDTYCPSTVTALEQHETNTDLANWWNITGNTNKARLARVTAANELRDELDYMADFK